MLRRNFQPIVLLLLVTLLLAGCAKETVDASQPPDQAEQDRKGALAAVMGYMEGRRARDLPRAYQHLSEPARLLFTQAEFVEYYSAFPLMDWQKVGPVNLVEENWARVVVYDISVTYADGHKELLADYPYYVQKSSGKWGVAVINPVVGRLESLGGDQKQVQGIFESLMKVNPFSSNLHVRIYYGAVESGDAQRAAEALHTLYMVSGPSDLANLKAMRAHFGLSTGQNAQALGNSISALRLADAYPERYDELWRARVLTNQAQVYMAMGEQAQARTSLEQALSLDPDNTEARSLLAQLRRL